MGTLNKQIDFNLIVSSFNEIANAHDNIKSFHCGYMDEVDIKKLGLEDYVILYLEPSSANLDTGILIFSFNVYVLDMANNQITGTLPNRIDDDVITNEVRVGRINAFSNTLQILQDVINEYKHSMYGVSASPDQRDTGSYAPSVSILQLPINIEPFTARFNNMLTGWVAQISIQVNNQNNLCISPITSPE